MKQEVRKNIQPVPVAAVGPIPRGGWGILGGLISAWAITVFLFHGRTLGFDVRILGQLYGTGQFRGAGSAGAWFGAMGGNLWHLFLAAAFTGAAAGWGMRALDLLRLPYPSPALRPLFGLAAGFALSGVALLGLGLAGFWYWWMAVLWVGGGWAALWPRRADLRALALPPAGSGWALGMKACLFAVAALVILVAMAPEAFYDSLVYHTADPLAWIKVHKVVFLKYNFFSNFPFTFEMLFAGGMLLGSDIVSRLIHSAICLTGAGLCGWMAWWLARRMEVGAPAANSGLGAGWLAALACLSTPIIGNSAWMTGIDGGLVLYEVAAVLAFVLWWAERGDGPARPGSEVHWIWLCAAMSGLGMGIKYTLGMTVGMLGLGIILRASAPDQRAALRALLWTVVLGLVPMTLGSLKEPQALGWATWGKWFSLAWYAALLGLGLRLALRWGAARAFRGAALAAVFGALALAFVSPWNIKSMLFTASPAYPFAFHTLGGFHLSPSRMDYQMGEFREFSFRTIPQFLAIPWKITEISGFSNNSSLGGLFLALLPLLLAFKGVDPLVKLLGVLLLGRYLMWANVSNIIRYFAPGLALLGVLGGVYIDRLCAPRPWIRAAGYAASGAFFLSNLYVMLLVAQGSVYFLGVVTGLESRRDYLLKERSSMPCPPYLACEAMNRDLPAGSGVLYVGEARGYFYRGRIVASTVFDFPPLMDATRESRTVADLNRKMRQLGVRYVFFSESESQRTAGYRIFDWETPRQRALFEKWWTGNLDLVWKGGQLEVMEIVPAGVKERTSSLKLVQRPFDEYDSLLKALTRMDRAAAAANYETAEADAKEVLAKAPEVPAVLEGLAQIYAVWGKDRKAVETYQKALKLGLVSASAHHNLAILYQRMGRPGESMKQYQLANELQTKWKTGE